MKYSIDTSALMEAEVRHYPSAVFPTLWTRLEGLIAVGDLVASDEVLVELSQYAGDLHNWCRTQPQMFLPSDASVQAEVARLMAVYPDFVLPSGQSSGDPFVVAIAVINRITVVTQEKAVGPGGGRPKIPNVCAGEGVLSMSLLDMIRAEGWTF